LWHPGGRLRLIRNLESASGRKASRRLASGCQRHRMG
jgi:hypothetical protein